MENLASKYRPRSFEDLTEQSTVVEILSNMAKQNDLTCRNFLFIGSAGVGKAQPLTSKILTPTGFIEMRDVKVGTKVFTHKGNIGEVSGVYPQGVRPIYRITLQDRTFIDVSDEHLNIVYTYDRIASIRHDVVATTYELIDMIESLEYGDIYIPAVDLSSSQLAHADIDFKESGCAIDRVNNEALCKITNIERIEDQECQCIMVDHDDHTYISDFMIPTHNTTSARIIGTMLNGGSSDNVIEIDAASHNGVDSMKELVQQMKTYPIGTKYKVFIIDEVHVITQQGWQVLLKSLEEQPARTIVIMCTTDPEKIPATILSRVQVFQLSKISLAGVQARLKYILDSEISEGRSITYTDDAVNFIAKLGNGGMRASITNLDKALAYNSNITIENVEKALNLPNYDDYFALLGALAKKDNTLIVSTINNVYNSGINFTKWFEGFHSFICNIMKYIFLQDIHATMIPSHYESKIKGYTTAHSTFCLKLANKLVEMNKDLKSTQYLQEVAMTYLCVPNK